MKTNRRDFLKLAAGAAVAPLVWIPKRAYATTTAGFGATRHLLVLYAKGGLRSHCLFNAVGTAPHLNPFGAEPALTGRAWSLGSAGVRMANGTPVPAVTYTDASNNVVTVPDLASVSADITVLGCVDHDPTGPAEVDHRYGSNRVGTGDPLGSDGMLSRVGRDHPMYANGFSLSAVPPVEIGPTEFSNGSGLYAATRPLSLLSATGSFISQKPIGQGWKVAARNTLDSRFENTRQRGYRPRLKNFLTSKANAVTFASMLEDPRLDVVNKPTATDAGFTNAQLLSIFGNYDLSTIGDFQPNMSWGAGVAMALRFFAFGSPMVVVTREMYDMHDQEEVAFRPRTQDLCRQLQGLHYVLKAMPHPSGGTYWDHTLVMTLSEFSRNNTGTNGFNSGAGSDHVLDSTTGAQRNQAIALMGGPIAFSKGKLLGPTDSNILPLDPTQVFTSQQLLQTMVDALGVPQSYFGVNPISSLYA